jgi:hypothetical protein
MGGGQKLSVEQASDLTDAVSAPFPFSPEDGSRIKLLKRRNFIILSFRRWKD